VDDAPTGGVKEIVALLSVINVAVPALNALRVVLAVINVVGTELP
jgi:hypothetical protein